LSVGPRGGCHPVHGDEFAWLRERLFLELRFAYPAFRFVAVERVRGGRQPGHRPAPRAHRIEDRSIAEAAGLVTWNRMNHLILTLAAELRQHGRCLIDRVVTADFVRQLGADRSALLAQFRIICPRPHSRGCCAPSLPSG
jgi:hypothetical protein